MKLNTKVGYYEDVFVYDGTEIEEDFSQSELEKAVDMGKLMKKYLEENKLSEDFVNWVAQIENVESSMYVVVDGNTVRIDDAVYLEDEKEWVLDIPQEKFYYDAEKELYVRKFENLSESAKKDYDEEL